MRTNFALFLLIIFGVATVSGWGWPDIAKIMPVYVAAMPGLVMIIVQIYREATGWETGRSTTSIDMDESGENQLDEATARKRTLAFFAWFIGGALGIWLIGIVYASAAIGFSLRSAPRQGKVAHIADYRRLRLFSDLGFV